jgi:hypothetical protein
MSQLVQQPSFVESESSRAAMLPEELEAQSGQPPLVQDEPPPDGHQPLVGCYCCFPPGGAYWDLAVCLTDYLNDGVQCITFVQHHDYMFAAGCVGLFTTCAWMARKNPPTSDCALWKHASQSVRQGRITDGWFDLLAIERSFEAPFTGYLMTYGMSLRSHLTPLQALSAGVGFALSVKAWSVGRVYMVDAALKPEACKIVFPHRYKALFVWRGLGAMAEFSGFAICARVVHPSLAVLGYIGSLLQCCRLFITFLRGKEDTWDELAGIFSRYIFGSASALRVYGDDSYQTLTVLVTALARHAFWCLLCILLKMPDGMLPWGTFSRPMGSDVLDEVFMQPTITLLEGVRQCVDGFQSSALAWDSTHMTCNIGMFHSDRMTAGSSIFNSIIFCVALVIVPIYDLILLYQILFNAPYWRGECDREANRKVNDIQKRIDAWGERRERRYSQFIETAPGN